METAPTKTEVQPEIPNVTPPEAPIAVEGSTIEKIRTSGAKVFAAAGQLFSKGRGRPRKDGQPGKSDIPLNGPAPAAPVVPGATVQPVISGFDPAMVKKCVSAVFKAASGILNKILFTKAVNASKGDVRFANELCKSCEITPEEMDSFSDLASICLQKYGVGTEYVPEIGAAVILGGIGVRYYAAFKSLQVEVAASPANPDGPAQ